MNTKQHYVVKYSTGWSEGYSEKIIFVTDNKDTAEKYVAKFNRVLDKALIHYKNTLPNFHELFDTNNAFFEEVKFRP